MTHILCFGAIAADMPYSDLNTLTGYGETLYRDADIEFYDDELLEDEDKILAADYRRARMAFLFGEYEMAFKIWHPQAVQGYGKAQATIGWMYHTGKGVKKDFNTAFEWYTKAAEQNHVIAQNNLGVFYEQGLGKTRKNLMKASKWYREAAELGYPYAQYNLGVLYKEGTGVSKNINEAIFWLQIAALQGVQQAQEELEKISRTASNTIDAHKPSTSDKALHKPAWIRITPKPNPVPVSASEPVAPGNSPTIPHP